MNVVVFLDDLFDVVEVMFVVIFVQEPVDFCKDLSGQPGEPVEIDEEQTILESPNGSILQPAQGSCRRWSFPDVGSRTGRRRFGNCNS